jgi:hypothetical protein
MANKIAAYDDDGIWGVGDTEEQARAEAEGFVRECYTGDKEKGEEACRALKTAPVSDDLLARATAGGELHINYTDYPFLLNDEGVLVFDEDKAEANDDDGVTEFIEGEDDDGDGVPAGTIDEIADRGHAVDPEGEGGPPDGATTGDFKE